MLILDTLCFVLAFLVINDDNLLRKNISKLTLIEKNVFRIAGFINVSRQGIFPLLYAFVQRVKCKNVTNKNVKYNK